MAYNNKKLKVFNSKTKITVTKAFDETLYLKYNN